MWRFFVVSRKYICIHYSNALPWLISSVLVLTWSSNAAITHAAVCLSNMFMLKQHRSTCLPSFLILFIYLGWHNFSHCCIIHRKTPKSWLPRILSMLQCFVDKEHQCKSYLECAINKNDNLIFSNVIQFLLELLLFRN